MSPAADPTFIDLSHTLDATTPVYPGNPPFHAHPHRDPTTGLSIHALSLSSHAGAHVDAPSHLFPAAPTISALSLSTFLVIAESLANLEALMEVQEGLEEGKRLMVSLVLLKIAECDGSPVGAFACKA